MASAGEPIETGGRCVLVDLGFGEVELDCPAWVGGRSGALFDNLNRAGDIAEDIDTIVLTPVHSGHAGWMLTDAELTFANARDLAGEAEHRTANPEVPFAPHGQLAALDRIEESVDSPQIAPSVTILSTSGHTHGHQRVLISSGTGRALLTGDVLHCSVQVAESKVQCIFDVGAALARRSARNGPPTSKPTRFWPARGRG